jgi:hypothetical protein
MKRLKSRAWLQSDFFSQGHKLREHFEDVFDDSAQTDRRRLAFEPWYHEATFYLLRTLGETFFSRPLFDRFQKKLITCAQTQFGCHGVSPIWLSLYTNGHYQKTHVDAPHGPLAFVYSLSPKAFARNGSLGGQTVILGEKIPSRLGDLLVFDPAQKHRVATVHGPKHPLDGRLVLNGWFVNPRPFVEGPLSLSESEPLIQKCEGIILRALGTQVGLRGFLSLKLSFAASGDLKQVKLLCSTLNKGNREVNATPILTQNFGRNLVRDFKVSPHKRSSTVTLPLVFR